MGREYIPLGILLTIVATALIWFQFYALPRIERDREEERRNAANAAPESHSKSSE